jgi:hypothetical protein
MSAEMIAGTVQFGDEEPAECRFLVQQRPGERANILVPLDRELADGDVVTFRFDWSRDV